MNKGLLYLGVTFGLMVGAAGCSTTKHLGSPTGYIDYQRQENPKADSYAYERMAKSLYERAGVQKSLHELDHLDGFDDPTQLDTDAETLNTSAAWKGVTVGGKNASIEDMVGLIPKDLLRQTMDDKCFLEGQCPSYDGRFNAPMIISMYDNVDSPKGSEDTDTPSPVNYQFSASNGPVADAFHKGLENFLHELTEGKYKSDTDTWTIERKGELIGESQVFQKAEADSTELDGYIDWHVMFQGGPFLDKHSRIMLTPVYTPTNTMERDDKERMQVIKDPLHAYRRGTDILLTGLTYLSSDYVISGILSGAGVYWMNTKDTNKTRDIGDLTTRVNLPEDSNGIQVGKEPLDRLTVYVPIQHKYDGEQVSLTDTNFGWVKYSLFPKSRNVTFQGSSIVLETPNSAFYAALTKWGKTGFVIGLNKLIEEIYEHNTKDKKCKPCPKDEKPDGGQEGGTPIEHPTDPPTDKPESPIVPDPVPPGEDPVPVEPDTPPEGPFPPVVDPQPPAQPEPPVVDPQPPVQPEPPVVDPQPPAQPEPPVVDPQPPAQPEPPTVPYDPDLGGGQPGSPGIIGGQQ